MATASPSLAIVPEQARGNRIRGEPRGSRTRGEPLPRAGANSRERSEPPRLFEGAHMRAKPVQSIQYKPVAIGQRTARKVLVPKAQ